LAQIDIPEKKKGILVGGGKKGTNSRPVSSRPISEKKEPKTRYQGEGKPPLRCNNTGGMAKPRKISIRKKERAVCEVLPSNRDRPLDRRPCIYGKSLYEGGYADFLRTSEKRVCPTANGGGRARTNSPIIIERGRSAKQSFMRREGLIREVSTKKNAAEPNLYRTPKTWFFGDARRGGVDQNSERAPCSTHPP